MTTPNPDRRIGEEKPMTTNQTSEAGEITVERCAELIHLAGSTKPWLMMANSDHAERCRRAARDVIAALSGSAPEPQSEISHLRAQLAEGEKELVKAGEFLRDYHIRGESIVQLNAALLSAQSERDAAQARVGEMEGLLREARESMAAWKSIMPREIESGETQAIIDRIDAALATSPNRLAGRGDR